MECLKISKKNKVAKKLLDKFMISKYERAYQYEAEEETHTVVLKPRDIEMMNEMKLYPWRQEKKRSKIFKIYKRKVKFGK